MRLALSTGTSPVGLNLLSRIRRAYRIFEEDPYSWVGHGVQAALYATGTTELFVRLLDAPERIAWAAGIAVALAVFYHREGSTWIELLLGFRPSTSRKRFDTTLDWLVPHTVCIAVPILDHYLPRFVVGLLPVLVFAVAAYLAFRRAVAEELAIVEAASEVESRVRVDLAGSRVP